MAADRRFMKALSREAFGQYGDYARIIEEWVEMPGVETTVAEVEGRPRGAFLLAFAPDGDRTGTWVADLLAIAVEKEARNSGLGRALLEAAISRSRGVGGVVSLVLSVAEENLIARQLFESAGFRYVSQDDGRYPAGQRALRMRLAL